jgi:epoxyqueuosine reductase QueG
VSVSKCEVKDKIAMEENHAGKALTGRIKDYALSVLGADLVGIADIGRFAHAPAMMSPQGILPTARSVVVMAVHHPDAAIEMGGREHPQKTGPYSVQSTMNNRLDEISYRMGLWLEKEGYAAVPIVSSNIWRYNGYKDLKELFAPDMSHLHAAVAAGLAEFGYNGLAITPEFGARQRYVSVITEAALQPTPLLEPGSVCDNCMLCRKHCMSGALSEEIDGWNEVKIEDKVYRYARKNLWRCSWGEHFNLDLDLPKPDRVDEAVILEMVKKHGLRGGEMGSCLRYCLPGEKRYFDPEYTNAPRRRRRFADNANPGRMAQERLQGIAYRQGIDHVVITPVTEFEACGVDIKALLPDAVTAVTLVLHDKPRHDAHTLFTHDYMLRNAAYDLARKLERMGYSAMGETGIPEEVVKKRISGILPGREIKIATVLTSAELTPTSWEIPLLPQVPALSPSEWSRRAKALLAGLGADLIGIAPAERLSALLPQLKAAFEGQEYLLAKNRSQRYFTQYDPEITTERVHVLSPDDHLPGAKSVIVAGMRLPAATVARTAMPPAEAVGPYAFAQYETAKLLNLMGYRLIRLLEDCGFNAVATFDLCGTGSFINNPRGEQPDIFSNRFAAVAAGLGHIGKGGFVLTPEFGPNIRFIAIVTDIEMEVDPVSTDRSPLTACSSCDHCAAACHTRALSGEASISVEGYEERFYLLDRNRCDWAKRYSMVGAEGVDFLGWNMKMPIPDKIDAEKLADSLKQLHIIKKHRICNFEACALACPLSKQESGQRTKQA